MIFYQILTKVNKGQTQDDMGEKRTTLLWHMCILFIPRIKI